MCEFQKVQCITNLKKKHLSDYNIEQTKIIIIFDLLAFTASVISHFVKDFQNSL